MIQNKSSQIAGTSCGNAKDFGNQNEASNAHLGQIKCTTSIKKIKMLMLTW
jgi:hypothetical protein